MATQTLVEYPIEAGRHLLKRMDAAGLEITVAFWQFREETEQWQLYLASPLVATIGPSYIIHEINQILDEMPPEERDDLSLLDILVYSEHRLPIEKVRARYGTVTQERERYGRRYRYDRDETYIYRLL